LCASSNELVYIGSYDEGGEAGKLVLKEAEKLVLKKTQIGVRKVS